MARVFISYRRQDSAGHARALYDRLAQRFPGQVFMDVAGSIAPGADFVDAIEKAIGSCRVLLVIIGRDWTSGSVQVNRQRLDDPNDFVRVEIAAALSRGVVVVPVLVEEGRMPTAAELPENIARLARIQAIELRDTRWDADVDTLISELLRITQGNSTSLSDGTAIPEGARPADVAVTEDLRSAAGTRLTGSGDRASYSKYNSRRRRQLVAIVLGFVVLFGTSLAGYYWWEKRGAEIPNLVGLPVDKAEERLQSGGLALGKITVQRTSQFPPKVVLEQSATPGTKSKRGMTVTLVIAGRPVVPNVVGKDLGAARTELSAAGFETRVKPEPTNRFRPGTVLRVTPPEGTEVIEKSAVELIVAAALGNGVVVPNVIGKVLSDAMRELSEAGFVPRRRAGTRNSRIADLQVVAQDPEAGGRLARGGVVASEFNPVADANPTPPLIRNVTILYPDNRRTQAEDLAQSLRGPGWQATAKSGGSTARAGTVVYFVRTDSPTAQGLADRAKARLEQQGQRGRSFRAEFEAPSPGTLAAEGGFFIVYTY